MNRRNLRLTIPALMAIVAVVAIFAAAYRTWYVLGVVVCGWVLGIALFVLGHWLKDRRYTILSVPILGLCLSLTYFGFNEAAWCGRSVVPITIIVAGPNGQPLDQASITFWDCGDSDPHSVPQSTSEQYLTNNLGSASFSTTLPAGGRSGLLRRDTAFVYLGHHAISVSKDGFETFTSRLPLNGKTSFDLNSGPLPPIQLQLNSQATDTSNCPVD